MKIKGQEHAYAKAITGAVGGAAGVTHCGDTLRTDCEPNDNVEALRMWMDEHQIEQLTFYKASWCEKCKNTWFVWRMWVHEVLVLWEYIEKHILNSASVNEMTKVWKENWMITIVQDAILKAAMWQTTLDEALKLI